MSFRVISDTHKSNNQVYYNGNSFITIFWLVDLNLMHYSYIINNECYSLISIVFVVTLQVLRLPFQCIYLLMLNWSFTANMHNLGQMLVEKFPPKKLLSHSIQWMRSSLLEYLHCSIHFHQSSWFFKT